MVTNTDSILIMAGRATSLMNDVVLPFLNQPLPVNIVDRKRRRRRIVIISVLSTQATNASRRAINTYDRKEFESAADHVAIALENVSAAVTLINSWAEPKPLPRVA